MVTDKTREASGQHERGGILFPYQTQRVSTKWMPARNYTELFRIRQDIVIKIIQIRKQNLHDLISVSV